MNSRMLAIFLIEILLVGGVAADVAVSSGDATAHDDLFEGATVTGYSGVETTLCNVNDAFGSGLGWAEAGSVFAINDQTLRLEFNSGQQTVNQIVISLAEDDTGTGSRAADAIRFYAYSEGDWNPVFDLDLGFTYTTSYGDNNIIVTANLDSAITTDSWALEMDSVSGPDLSGARLFEIDGYNVVPEPATVALMGMASGLGLLIRRRFLI